MTYRYIKNWIKKEKLSKLPDDQLLDKIHERLNQSTRACNKWASKDFLITADEDNKILAIEYLYEYKGYPPPFQKKEKKGQRLFDYYSTLFGIEEAKHLIRVFFGEEEGFKILRGLGVW